MKELMTISREKIKKNQREKRLKIYLLKSDEID